MARCLEQALGEHGLHEALKALVATASSHCCQLASSSTSSIDSLFSQKHCKPSRANS